MFMELIISPVSKETTLKYSSIEQVMRYLLDYYIILIVLIASL
jgi:hypothetical protein